MQSDTELKFPDRLYRYRSLATDYAWDELHKAIRNGEVFLASAENVNDPFDFRPDYRDSLARDVLKDLKETHGSKRIFSRSQVAEIIGSPVSRGNYRRTTPTPSYAVANSEIEVNRSQMAKLRKKCKLACFSESGLIVPMWAHYASNHTGICLVYEVDPNFHSDEIIPLPVRHSMDRPKIDTLDLRAFTERSRSERASEGNRIKIHDAIFLNKGEDWSYEREWRLFEFSARPAGYERTKSLKVIELYFGLNAAEHDIDRAVLQYGSSVRLVKLEQSTTSYSFDLSYLN